MDCENLRDKLYSATNPPIPWMQRLDISIGIARGLHYLHSQEEGAVILSNVQPVNIFVGEKWNAKVSDFGHVCGRDPESLPIDHQMKKTHVFLSGLLLFDVIYGIRQPFSTNVDYGDKRKNLLEWAQKCRKKGNFHENVDPNLWGRIAPLCLRKYLEIAMRCMRYEAFERPTMGKVVEVLEDAKEEQRWADIVMEEDFNPHREYSYPDGLFRNLRHLDTGSIVIHIDNDTDGYLPHLDTGSIIIHSDNDTDDDRDVYLPHLDTGSIIIHSDDDTDGLSRNLPHLNTGSIIIHSNDDTDVENDGEIPID